MHLTQKKSYVTSNLTSQRLDLIGHVTNEGLPTLFPLGRHTGAKILEMYEDIVQSIEANTKEKISSF